MTTMRERPAALQTPFAVPILAPYNNPALAQAAANAAIDMVTKFRKIGLFLARDNNELDYDFSVDVGEESAYVHLICHCKQAGGVIKVSVSATTKDGHALSMIGPLQGLVEAANPYRPKPMRVRVYKRGDSPNKERWKVVELEPEEAAILQPELEFYLTELRFKIGSDLY